MLNCFSHVLLFATLWTVAHQAPLSMGFSRQEHWNGLPCPLPGNLPDPGIEPRSPALEADSLPSKPPGKPIYIYILFQILFPCRLLQNTEHNSLYIVGPCWLSILCTVPWRRKWQPTPVFLPGESHGRRSLVGCSPLLTESDTTEAT